MKKNKNHLLVAGVLAGVILVFLAFMAMPSLYGKEILLDLRPVDPFDPLRGQYLTLAYDINNLDTLGLKNLTQGQAVYVLLYPDEKGISRPIASSAQPLTPQKDQVLIKGQIENGRAYFGIEAFFMERGAILNQPIQEAKARIKVLPDGRASVISLEKDGAPIKFKLKDVPFLER